MDRGAASMTPDPLPRIPANIRLPGPPVVTAREGEAGTAVLYRCPRCDLVVPQWGSLHGMKRRRAQWPRTMACLEPDCDGVMTPEEARRMGSLDFRVLLRLVEQRNLAAALKWWGQQPEAKLEGLPWRAIASKTPPGSGGAA